MAKFQAIGEFCCEYTAACPLWVKADICAAIRHVRFTPNSDRTAKRHVRSTPESGHVQCTSSCLLWANSGHVRQNTSATRNLVDSLRSAHACSETDIVAARRPVSHNAAPQSLFASPKEAGSMRTTRVIAFSIVAGIALGAGGRGPSCTGQAASLCRWRDQRH